jgi:hypothetical protein
MPKALHLGKGLERLLGTPTNTDIFGQIHPAHRASRIDKKLCRPRDVLAFWPSAGMQNVITPNHLRVFVGEQWKRIAQLFALPLIDVRRINADADHANAARIEFRKPSLKTPQLGVA